MIDPMSPLIEETREKGGGGGKAQSRNQTTDILHGDRCLNLLAMFVSVSFCCVKKRYHFQFFFFVVDFVGGGGGGLLLRPHHLIERKTKLLKIRTPNHA